MFQLTYLIRFIIVEKPLNLLSLKSDQHQFSPNDINTLLREKVMRMNKVITKGKML